MGIIESGMRAELAIIDQQIADQNIKIQAAANGFEEALSNIRPSPVHVPIIWDIPALPSSNFEAPEPQYFANGGTVQARGSDTVPAMLTPGERVLNRREAAEYRRGGHGGDFSSLKQEMAGLRRDMKRQVPQMVALAVRDASLQRRAG